MSHKQGTPPRAKSLLRTKFGWRVDRPYVASASPSTLADEKETPGPKEAARSESPTGGRSARDEFEEAAMTARTRFGFPQPSGDFDRVGRQSGTGSSRASPGLSHERVHWRRFVYPRTKPRLVSSSPDPDSDPNTRQENIERERDASGCVPKDGRPPKTKPDPDTKPTGSFGSVTISKIPQRTNFCVDVKPKEVNESRVRSSKGMAHHTDDDIPKLSVEKSSSEQAVPLATRPSPHDSVKPYADCDRDLGDDNTNTEQEDTSSDAFLVTDTTSEDTSATPDADKTGEDLSDTSSHGSGDESKNSTTEADDDPTGEIPHAQAHQMNFEELLAVHMWSRDEEPSHAISLSNRLDYPHLALALPTIAEVTEPSFSSSEPDTERDRLNDDDDDDDDRCSGDQAPCSDSHEASGSVHFKAESMPEEIDNSITGFCSSYGNNCSKPAAPLLTETPASTARPGNTAADGLYTARPCMVSEAKLWLRQPTPHTRAWDNSNKFGFEEETTSFLGDALATTDGGSTVRSKTNKKYEAAHEAAPKINVAKFAQSIQISKSETEGESGRDLAPKVKASAAAAAGAGARVQEEVIQTTTTFTPSQASKRQTSWQSQTSGEDNSWGDSPVVTPRKNSATRVSFKKDEELSEVHDITVTESEPESETHEPADEAGARAGQPMASTPAKTSQNIRSYIPSADTGATLSSPSQEKMLEGKGSALMKELGLSDVDDVSDVSDDNDAPPALPQSPPPKSSAANQLQPTTGADSDWDASAMSDLMATPRPGILKKWNNAGPVSSGEGDNKSGPTTLGVQDSPKQPAKVLLRAPAVESGDESSAWDTTEADKIQVTNTAAGGRVAGVAGALTGVASRGQRADSISEWDSDIEEMMNPTQPAVVGTTPTPPPPLPTATITKEVEAIVRQKQAEQDSEKEEEDDDDDVDANTELGGSGEIFGAPETGSSDGSEAGSSARGDKGRGKVGSDDEDWDSTVDSVTQKSNAGLHYKEVNIDAPASHSESAPGPAPVIPEAQVAATVAASPAKTAPRARPRDDDDDDSDDWDSDDEDVRTESASSPVYLPGVGGIGGGAAAAAAVSGLTGTAQPQKSPASPEKTPASPQKTTPIVAAAVDSEDEDDSESMSSWELQRKAERQAHMLAQTDVERESEKREQEAQLEAQRRQKEEEEEQERLRRERLEEEEQEKEAERVRKIEEQQRLEEEYRKQRVKEEEEERERQRQWEREEEERKRQEELQREWEREEEERKRQEELQRQWEVEEEMKAQMIQLESQKMLEKEAQQMEEDLLMKPEEAADTTDYLFSQQQELNRIDEQFQRERAEREKREEEEERQRKQQEDFVVEETIVGERVERAFSQMTSAPPPPPVLSPRPVADTNPSTKPSLVPPSAQTSTYVNLSNSTVDQIRQRLQVPPPTSSPSSTLGFSPGAFLTSAPGGDGFDDNESVLSENPGDDRSGLPKPYFQGMYRPNDPLDDDALSYTSTEFEDPVQSTPSYAKDRDLIASVNIGDPSSMLKVQEHVRDTRRQLEQERNQRQVLENKVKVTSKEKAELTKKLESLMQQKSALEQSKLDLEAKIRSLEYSVSEEEEKRKNAEILLEKTKEQLSRKETQFAGELEAKQRAELTMRNLQIEMRTTANTIKELEEEKEELQRQISHANNARLLQEQINEDQQKLIHAQTMQQQSMTPRESDAQDVEQAGDNDKMRAEVYALQMEMERQRSRFKDEVAMMGAENEELQARMEEMKNDIKLNEEALAHATMQYNMHMASLRSELTTSTSNCDRERAGREKVEAELDSLKTRLLAANHEMDKVVRARNDLERESRREKDSWSREIDRKDAEVMAVKDNLQHTTQRLQSTETKLNSMENEMHVSNTSLMERTAQLQQLRQDLDRTRLAHETLDQNYRIEKEQSAKMQAKLENTQEKLSNQQHENLSLRQQLDSLKLSGGGLPGSDANEKLNNILSNLRAESDRAKASLEEKNSSLLETVARLKEEARGSEVRRAGLEADLRRLQEEHSDLVRRAASAEASLQVASRAKEQLEQERASLRAELDQVQQRYQAAHDKATEAQARVSELLDRLDKAESSSVYSTQQLANTSANMQGLFKSKSELDESMQQLQVENVRLEAELKYEKQRADMLHQDLQDSQKVRSSLEALCANLKSTSAHLEDRLGNDDELVLAEGNAPTSEEENGFTDSRLDEETAARVLYESEARDQKALYDLETKSRSKLGLKIADLERNKQSSESKLGEEKNRAETANYEKKSLETRLDAEVDKNRQLQKDVSTLKAHLKAAKTKIKDMGGSSPRPADPQYSDFRRDVNNLETYVSTPRHHQQSAIDSRSPCPLVGDVMALRQSLNSLNRSRRRMESEVRFLEGLVSDAGGDVRAELEAKYRAELNRKLGDVNRFLESQSQLQGKLDTSRTEIEVSLMGDKRRLEEENKNLRVRYEQAVAQRETKEMEARRFRELYESEMKWRLRVSDQLQLATEKSFNLNSKLNNERHHRNRLTSNIGNLQSTILLNNSFDPASARGGGGGAGVVNGNSFHEDELSNKIRTELDKSIARHLEAAPHDHNRPILRSSKDLPRFSSALTQASHDYIDVLKRKYCV